MKTLPALLRTTPLLIIALVSGSTARLMAQSVDILDQSQPGANVWQNLSSANGAQSFIPREDKLSKVEVELAVGSGALQYVQLSILADDGTGRPNVAIPLATLNPVPGPDATVSDDQTTGWFGGNLNNLPVQPGQTYYIRVYLASISPDPRANWATADGTLDAAYENLYPNGSWWSGVGLLTPLAQSPRLDGTFKTYYPQALSPLPSL